MTNFNGSPDLQLVQALARCEELERQASNARLLRLRPKQRWQSRLANTLVGVAEWLEPTLQTQATSEMSVTLSK